MDTVTCLMYRTLILGAVMYVTASATLMMDYNWPVPDSSINRFPHESSCHYYYLMLSEEDISVEKCPDGQLFDYRKHSCISDKEHIHCWSRNYGKIKHGHIIKHRKHFKCPYPWGKYPNLHDCSKYHLCLHGKSSVKKCAPYELFDKITRKCIASIDAVCADKTDVVEHGYVCPKMWGSFTYSKDCSKYYECLQKKPSLRMCQKGFLFDDRLRKCEKKEHVYCGLRQNPYESVKTSSASTSMQQSTTYNLQETTITAKEKETSLKPASQETKTLQEISSSKDLPSSLQETSSVFKKVTPAQTSSIQPVIGDISSSSVVTEDNTKETKPKSSTANIQIEKEQRETIVVNENVSGKNELVSVSVATEKEPLISSPVSSEDLSDDLKKDVSTEETNTEISTKLPVIEKQENVITSELTKSATVTVPKPVCDPKDSMCTTEKDGTIVRCSGSKDLQPHPKDERRFVDCSGSQVQIYTCPHNLTFFPKDKKCRWQFIMGAK